MPAVERYVDNDDGLFRDSAGNAMPPCIVIERGESLRDRMKIAHADRAGIAQVGTVYCVVNVLASGLMLTMHNVLVSRLE